VVGIGRDGIHGQRAAQVRRRCEAQEFSLTFVSRLMHSCWKRYLLAAILSVAGVFGTVGLGALIEAHLHLLSSPRSFVESTLIITFGGAALFLLLLTAIHACSYLLPRGARGSSSYFSAMVFTVLLAIALLGAAFLNLGCTRDIFWLVPLVVLTSIPVWMAAGLSCCAHTVAEWRWEINRRQTPS
jgi:hypothetical protein